MVKLMKSKADLKYSFYILVWSFLFACETKKTESYKFENHDSISKQEVIGKHSKLDSSVVYKTDMDYNLIEYFPDSVLLNYMNAQFKRNGDTVYISNETLKLNNCSWRINYNNGNYYEFSECNEWGVEVFLKFKNKKKEDIIKLIETQCYRKNYTWFENFTEYRPFQYYESVWTFRITELNDGVLLELY